MGGYTAAWLDVKYYLKTLSSLYPRANKLFCDIGYQREVVSTPLDLAFGFKISFRVIQRLIQHWFLSKMVYLNVKYMIVTGNYDILNSGTVDLLIKCNLHL